MSDIGMSLRSGSTSKRPDKGPTMEGDGTNRPTIEYDTLFFAFIEALSNPSVVAKLNKAIDYDRISTAVSNQVEILIKPLTDKLAEKDAQIDKLHTKCQALEERCDDLEQYSRKDSIRIFGLDEPHDENPFDSVIFFMQYSNENETTSTNWWNQQLSQNRFHIPSSNQAPPNDCTLCDKSSKATCDGASQKTERHRW